MSKLWTPEEVKILRDNYKEESDVTRVADMLGRPRAGVKHKASRIGLKIRDGKDRIRIVKGHKYWYRCIKREPVFIHRIIAEELIGRPLTSDDIVHHLDGDSLNNDPSNLVVTTRAEHMGKYHLDICLEKLQQINGV